MTRKIFAAIACIGLVVAGAFVWWLHRPKPLSAHAGLYESVAVYDKAEGAALLDLKAAGWHRSALFVPMEYTLSCPCAYCSWPPTEGCPVTVTHDERLKAK